MKLDRLISILVTLLQRERVSARELADMFEVSTRTILRDVDTINLSGIPIVTYQGTNGGIAIAEGYKLDKSLLTSDDIAAVIATLKGIAKTLPDPKHQVLVDKFENIVPTSQSENVKAKTNRLIIDLSPWGGSKLINEKLNTLRKAIEQETVIEFSYMNSNGTKTERRAEPCSLVLKGQNWYLYAFCLLRNEPRLFKVARINELKVLNETFVNRNLTIDDLKIEETWENHIKPTEVELLFDAELFGLVTEWFETYEKEQDGRIRVKMIMPENYWFYGYILSFGPGVEVIKPLSLRQQIKELASGIARKND